MVEKIIKMLGQKVSGLHDAAYLLAAFALISQVLALVRDRLLAHFFGAGPLLDVYYASFRIPDIIYASIASMVSISVLIPFLSSRLEDNELSAKKFISSIFTLFFIFITVVSIAVFIFAPKLISLVYPGFEGEARENVVMLTRILLFSPIFLGLSNLLGSITQTFRQFFVYALSPVLYNIGIIFGVLALYPQWGLAGLGMGVMAGAFLHVLIQIPAVRKDGLVPRFTSAIDWQEIKKVITTSLPRTFALSAHQLTLLFLVSMATLMATGSITIFNFSFNLQSVPLSIIGVSYSLAAFPTLSRLYTSGKTKEFFSQIVEATRYIIFWAIPAIVFFIVLRAHVVRVILGSGEFDWSDTRLTAAALALFVVSLIGQSLNQLFVRGYYAAGNTTKPLVVNLISSAFIIVVSFFAVQWYADMPFLRYFIESLLRVEGISNTAILMLPLAYSLGLLLNGLMFWVLFQRDFKSFSRSLYRTLVHTTSASVIAGASIYLSMLFLGEVLDLATLLGVFMHGFVSGLAGVAVFIIVLHTLGNPELKEVLFSMKNKFWRTKPVAPDQESL